MKKLILSILFICVASSAFAGSHHDIGDGYECRARGIHTGTWKHCGYLNHLNNGTVSLTNLGQHETRVRFHLHDQLVYRILPAGGVMTLGHPGAVHGLLSMQRTDKQHFSKRTLKVLVTVQ